MIHTILRIGVDVAPYGPNQISMHFSSGKLVHFTSFLFQVTYCSSRWFAKLGPFPAAKTIDFSPASSDLPRKRSPPFATIYFETAENKSSNVCQQQAKVTNLLKIDKLPPAKKNEAAKTTVPSRQAVRANGRALALAPAALHADRACVLAAAQPLALFSNMH